jgi:rubrerythrin
MRAPSVDIIRELRHIVGVDRDKRLTGMETAMNIYEYAMKMESDGREYYLDQAQKQEHPALKKILIELADDELKHYRIFKAMRDGEPAEYRDEEKTTILSSVKNVFEIFRAEGKDLTFPESAKEVWEKAQEIEEESETFYREKAEEVGDDSKKQILNKIADEEHKHWVTMQNVVQFLDRPNHWLEDAEWSNLDQY